MKTSLNILLVFVSFVMVVSCDLNNSEDKSNNFDQLYNAFNGTWQPVRSFSDHPVDADLDGSASSDMLDELTNFDNGFLTIRIIEDPISETNYPHLFDLSYPVQAFPPETDPGDPGFYINYLINPAGTGFKVSETQDVFILDQELNSGRDQDKYPLPESVVFKNDRLIIEVVIQKRLYTASGWQTIEIRTDYARISENT